MFIRSESMPPVLADLPTAFLLLPSRIAARPSSVCRHALVTSSLAARTATIASASMLLPARLRSVSLRRERAQREERAVGPCRSRGHRAAA